MSSDLTRRKRMTWGEFVFVPLVITALLIASNSWTQAHPAPAVDSRPRVAVIMVPEQIDSHFVELLSSHYGELQNASGIILRVNTFGGEIVTTQEAAGILNSLHKNIVAYVEYGESGGFVLTEYTSSTIIVNRWAVFGFGHNSTYDFGNAGRSQAWKTLYEDVVFHVAQRRNMSAADVGGLLGNVYLGIDAVKYNLADLVVTDFSGAQDWERMLHGSDVVFVEVGP